MTKLLWKSWPVWLILSCLAALSCGPTGLHVHDLLNLDTVSGQILLQHRLPRLIVIAFGGATIGLTGLLLQLILRQRDLDASMLGIMHGAQFLTAVMIVLLPMLTTWSVMLSVSASLALLIAWKIWSPAATSSHYYLLIGIATAMTFQALTTLVTQGSGLPLPTLGTITWSKTLQFLIALLLGAILLTYVWPQLKYFALPQTQLRLLGIAERRYIYVILSVVALWTGAFTALIGVVFFLGVILPAIARQICPTKTTTALFGPVAILGSLLLINADTLARTLVAPIELPTTAILLALTGPLMILLLFKRGKTT